jgi:hypothetical protein
MSKNPPQSKFVETASDRIAYIEQGDGPVALSLIWSTTSPASHSKATTGGAKSAFRTLRT